MLTLLSAHSLSDSNFPEAAYTPLAVTSPGRLEREIQQWRHTVRACHWEALYREGPCGLPKRASVRPTAGARGSVDGGYLRLPSSPRHGAPRRWGSLPRHMPTSAKPRPIPPARSSLMRADRLKTAGLEQVRDIFNHGELGVVLIGMSGPGEAWRLSSTVFPCGLCACVPCAKPDSGASVVAGPMAPHRGDTAGPSLTEEEVLAAILRITGGNFRLLQRLLTQIARIVAINDLQTVTAQVVDTARDTLVIGMT